MAINQNLPCSFLYTIGVFFWWLFNVYVLEPGQ